MVPWSPSACSSCCAWLVLLASLAIVFAGGAFHLNRVDPKRLTAVLVVLVVGFGWLAYRTWNR